MCLVKMSAEYVYTCSTIQNDHGKNNSLWNRMLSSYSSHLKSQLKMSAETQVTWAYEPIHTMRQYFADGLCPCNHLADLSTSMQIIATMPKRESTSKNEQFPGHNLTLTNIPVLMTTRKWVDISPDAFLVRVISLKVKGHQLKMFSRVVMTWK